MTSSSADQTIPTYPLREVNFGLVATTNELRDVSTIRELETTLGPLWTIHTRKTYEQLANALVAGEVDLAWLPPVAYVRARANHEIDLVLALERAGAPFYASALIVRDDSHITRLDALRGKRAAWVDVWSASGYLVPRSILRAGGIDPDKVFAAQQFVGSHTAVIEAVACGVAQVGGTYCSVDSRGEIVRAAWNNSHPIKALAVSDSIPSDTICASAQIGRREGRMLAARLISLAAAGAHRELLLRTFGADRFTPGDPKRYDALAAAVANEPG